LKGFGQGLYPELFAIRVDETNLACPNAVVDPDIATIRCGYPASLLECEKTDARSNVRLWRSINPSSRTIRGRVGAQAPLPVFDCAPRVAA
jgi:hypothetical protein